MRSRQPALVDAGTIQQIWNLDPEVLVLVDGKTAELINHKVPQRSKRVLLKKLNESEESP